MPRPTCRRAATSRRASRAREERDPKIEIERAGHLVVEEAADASPVDAPDDFTAEPTEGQRVVAKRLPRLPHRTLRGEPSGHAPVIQHVIKRCPGRQRRQPGRVTHDVTDQHRLLPGCGELRPVLCDRSVEVELPSVREDRHADRDEPFASREHHLHGVASPGDAAVSVREPAPEIDHGLAVDVGREGRPKLTASREVAFELASHTLEPRLDVPLDHGESRFGVGIGRMI